MNLNDDDDLFVVLVGKCKNGELIFIEIGIWDDEEGEFVFMNYNLFEEGFICVDIGKLVSVLSNIGYMWLVVFL